MLRLAPSSGPAPRLLSAAPARLRGREGGREGCGGSGLEVPACRQREVCSGFCIRLPSLPGHGRELSVKTQQNMHPPKQPPAHPKEDSCVRKILCPRCLPGAAGPLPSPGQSGGVCYFQFSFQIYFFSPRYLMISYDGFPSVSSERHLILLTLKKTELV